MPSKSKKCDYNRLKTNLQLFKTRIDLLYRKKTELNVRGRREVAELLRNEKADRARLHVEHIIRQDYEAEALDMLMTLTQILLQNFGVFQNTKEVDVGLEKAIATMIWCTPRLSPQLPEMTTIKALFEAKYSKDYVQACLADSLRKVDPGVMQRLTVSTLSPNLIEQYMVEIAKAYDIPYEPMTTQYENAEDVTSRENENRLINFEPDDCASSQGLVSGVWNQLDQSWMTTPAVPGAPYPENPPFPTPSMLAPIGPPTDLQNVAPPSYDATMFPVKPSESAPPLPARPPDYDPIPPKACPSDSSSSSSDDDEELDELRRRFYELKKK